jgi:ABC-2 type transport system ATP-binding protein
LAIARSFDFFPRDITGWQFLVDSLMLYGMSKLTATQLAEESLQRVQLDKTAAWRKIDGYSKGMRQKIRFAQAIAHRPRVIVLDEPLNGLDPMARAEARSSKRSAARESISSSPAMYSTK